mmetsp:Transcript_43174/g.69802  ORF Transcript_43174/g.69802 Transcript_43174/m.69802 type:complete len:212 (-) Transcript_43174:310-945(-)
MHVGHKSLATVPSEVVGKESARVPHELTYVRRLAARRSSHVQNYLVLLWSKRHHRNKGRSTLDHVVPTQILRCSTHRHLGGVDLQTNLCPRAYRIHRHLALSQGLHQGAPSGLQRIGADGERPVLLVCLKKLDGLLCTEHLKEILGQLLRVPEVRRTVLNQIFKHLLPRPLVSHLLGLPPLRKKRRIILDLLLQGVQIRRLSPFCDSGQDP